MANQDDSLYSSNAGAGVDVGGWTKGDIYDSTGAAYLNNLRASAVNGYGKGLRNGNAEHGDETYGDADVEYGKG